MFVDKTSPLVTLVGSISETAKRFHLHVRNVRPFERCRKPLRETVPGCICRMFILSAQKCPEHSSDWWSLLDQLKSERWLNKNGQP